MPEPDQPATLIAEVIRSRRTTNQFLDEVPPNEVILKGLELACWAPNHKLTEPWRFYLLGRETSQRIVELNAEMIATKKGPEAAQKKREKWSSIPGWLVVTYQRANDELRDKENYAAVCCGIQNLSLFLWSEGIGMKWTTGPVTQCEGTYEILKLNREQEEIVGVMWYGYPANSKEMAPKASRKPLSEIMKQLP